MSADRILQEAAAWFKKLSNPSTSTSRLLHARCVREGVPSCTECISKARSDRKIVRGLVATHSEGNASLHMGNYITQEVIDEVRKEVLVHDFKKGK